MTDKELRRLSRTELLEILLDQSQEIESLRTQLEEANAKLEERAILLSEAGSIAEAALRLNNVFESAQAAGQLYVDSLAALYRREASRMGLDQIPIAQPSAASEEIDNTKGDETAL